MPSLPIIVLFQGRAGDLLNLPAGVGHTSSGQITLPGLPSFIFFPICLIGGLGLAWHGNKNLGRLQWMFFLKKPGWFTDFDFAWLGGWKEKHIFPKC